jgi:outer membrane protein insertion porin family
VSPTNTLLTKNINGDYTRSQLYLGGEKEFFGNVELTFPLIAEAGLKGVLFFDYGNSFMDNTKAFNPLLTSYGYGIRWASPIGPLRLEYGIPLNPRTGVDSTSGRLEFSIGSMF